MGAVLYPDGTTFRVWAPFAEAVSVVGDFEAPFQPTSRLIISWSLVQSDLPTASPKELREISEKLRGNALTRPPEEADAVLTSSRHLHLAALGVNQGTALCRTSCNLISRGHSAGCFPEAFEPRVVEQMWSMRSGNESNQVQPRASRKSGLTSENIENHR